MNFGPANHPAVRAALGELRPVARREASGGEGSADRGAGTRPGLPRRAAPSRSFWFAPRVRRRDVADFTSQLAIMTRTGVDIAGALETLARQQRRGPLREVLADVRRRVLDGSSLSESLAAHAGAFGMTYVASVAAGEKSGRLPDVLHQLATLLRGEMKLRNAVRAMLAYPLILTIVSSLVLAAMLLFVLPKFEKVFDDFDAPLPVLTRCLLGVSQQLRERAWLWGPVFLGGLAGLAAVARSPGGKRAWDHLALHLAVLRGVTRALMIGRICRLLGMMIESGVPLLESLRLTRNAVQNALYRELFDELERDVLNGRGLSAALASHSFIPPAAAEMITTAENTGTLGPVAQMVGAHFEEEGETRLREVVAIAEPLLTVLLGFGVAVIVLSVMLPLFDLSSVVKGH